jgi:hypothetical protein
MLDRYIPRKQVLYSPPQAHKAREIFKFLESWHFGLPVNTTNPAITQIADDDRPLCSHKDLKPREPTLTCAHRHTRRHGTVESYVRKFSIIFLRNGYTC